MRAKRLAALWVSMVIISTCGFSAFGDEKGGSTQTNMGSTTIGGSVNSSSSWQTEHGFWNWLSAFLHSFQFRA
jgi:hypothetical protein